MINNNIISDSFLSNPIIKSYLVSTILDNDFHIYGPFVREILFENKSWDYYQKSSINTIHLLGLEKNRKWFENCIDRIIVSTISHPKTSLSTISSGINYLVDVNNASFILHISYFDSIDMNNLMTKSWDIRVIVNLDLIYINKYSLSVLKMGDRITSNQNLLSVIQDLTSKKFRVVTDCITSFDLDYIKCLINDGYKNLDSKIEKCLGIHHCSICYEDENTDYSRLSCNHIFHSECLAKAISIKLKEPKNYYFKCPYCNKKYQNYEVIE